MKRRPLHILPFALGIYACTWVSGVADLKIGTDSVGGAEAREDGSTLIRDDASVIDGDGNDAGATCAAPARCVKAPSGWEGPFAVVSVGKAGESCPGGFVRSWERIGSLAGDAEPAQCTCSCGAIGGTCKVTLLEHDPDNCSGAAKPRPLLPNVCIETGPGVDSWKLAALPMTTCPTKATVTVGALDGGASTLGCVPSSEGACVEGQCVPPTPTNTRLCVRTDGELGCPAGWPNSISLAQGTEDTRGCSPCTCTATSPTCSFAYALYDSNDCTGTGVSSSASTCQAPGGIDSARLNSVSLSGSCSPSGGKPVGGVTKSPASTLCCQP